MMMPFRILVCWYRVRWKDQKQLSGNANEEFLRQAAPGALMRRLQGQQPAVALFSKLCKPLEFQLPSAPLLFAPVFLAVVYVSQFLPWRQIWEQTAA